MTRTSIAAAALLAVATIAFAQSTADWIWWEAENPTSTSFGRKTHFDATTFPENGYLLSGQEWLTHEGPREAPTVTASYQVEVKTTATYHFFVRKFWLHGPFRWRFDEAAWDTLGRDVVALDKVPIRHRLQAIWYSMGKVALTKGTHTFVLELIDEPGRKRKQQICAIDCFLLTRGPYSPAGNKKPSGGFGIEATLNARYITDEKEIELKVTATRPEDRFLVALTTSKGVSIDTTVSPSEGEAVWTYAVGDKSNYTFAVSVTDAERTDSRTKLGGYVMPRNPDGSVPELGHELKVWVDLANHPQPPSVWTNWELEYPALRHALAKAEDKPYEGLRGFQVRTTHSLTWGQEIPYTVYVPDSLDLSEPVPAMVYLHGHGGSFQAVPEYRQRFERDYETNPMIMIGPNGTVKAWYEDMGVVNVMEVVKDALKKYPIDPDRLHIMGESMGGAGALEVARRYPDTFSGVTSTVGAWFDLLDMASFALLSPKEQQVRVRSNGATYMVNIAHVPSIFATGTRDHSMPFSAMAATRIRKLWGGDSEAWVYDAGHGLPPDEYRWENVRQKFMGAVRTPARERMRIRYRTDQMRFNTSGWVTVDAPLAWRPIVDIDCQKDVPEKGHLSCRLTNVRTATLNPTGVITAIHIDDQTLPVGTKGPVTISLVRNKWTIVKPRPINPSHKNPKRAGPLRDALCTPFVMVYGTRGDATGLKEWAEMSSFQGEAGWKGFHGGRGPAIPVIADTAALADTQLLSTKTLVCFGGAARNEVVKRLDLPTLPVSLEQSDTSNLILSMLRPSPYADNRYVVVNQASSTKAMAKAINIQQPVDWALYEASDCFFPFRTSLRVGFFDDAWEVAEED